MGDIGLGTSRQIAVAKNPQLRSGMIDDAGDQRVSAVLRLAQHHRHKIVERAPLDDEALVHIELTEPHIGIDEECPLRAVVGKADSNRLAGAVTECQHPAARRHHGQIAPRDDRRQRALYAPVRQAGENSITPGAFFSVRTGHHPSLPTLLRRPSRLTCQSSCSPGATLAPAISQTPSRIKPLPITCRATIRSPKTNHPVAMIST